MKHRCMFRLRFRSWVFSKYYFECDGCHLCLAVPHAKFWQGTNIG